MTIASTHVWKLWDWTSKPQWQWDLWRAKNLKSLEGLKIERNLAQLREIGPLKFNFNEFLELIQICVRFTHIIWRLASSKAGRTWHAPNKQKKLDAVVITCVTHVLTCGIESGHHSIHSSVVSPAGVCFQVLFHPKVLGRKTGWPAWLLKLVVFWSLVSHFLFFLGVGFLPACGSRIEKSNFRHICDASRIKSGKPTRSQNRRVWSNTDNSKFSYRFFSFFLATMREAKAISHLEKAWCSAINNAKFMLLWKCCLTFIRADSQKTLTRWAISACPFENTSARQGRMQEAVTKKMWKFGLRWRPQLQFPSTDTSFNWCAWCRAFFVKMVASPHAGVQK